MSGTQAWNCCEKVGPYWPRSRGSGAGWRIPLARPGLWCNLAFGPPLCLVDSDVARAPLLTQLASGSRLAFRGARGPTGRQRPGLNDDLLDRTATSGSQRTTPGFHLDLPTPLSIIFRVRVRNRPAESRTTYHLPTIEARGASWLGSDHTTTSQPWLSASSTAALLPMRKPGQRSTS